ncbi:MULTISPECIES: hypothetical protein [Actinomyces]|jgi:hypothetical protein|uniref:hypothetical protein n=1 Tax=Actinomyces TaxID=1654 RepID=UPI000930031D|nr:MULTISPECIES: hypothetical protein [Actinomyces]
MDSSILFTALGLPFGCLGLYVWYIETYTDTPLAQFWRAYGKANAPRRVNEIAIPLWMLCMISASLLLFSIKIALPQHIQSVFAGSIPFFLMLSIVFLLPIPIPHLVDQQWQWHKRQGFLDENRQIIAPTPSLVNNLTFTFGDISMSLTATMELPDTWRALSLPNPKAILTPQIPPIVNATSAHPRSPLDDALFVAVGIPEKTSGFRPNFIVTIDLMGKSPIPLDDIIPGWMTIEETRFPIPSDDTLMTTGLYVDEGLSYTAIQWTWTQTVSNRTVRLYATATATTTSINSIADQLPRMLETLQVIP